MILFKHIRPFRWTLNVNKTKTDTNRYKAYEQGAVTVAYQALTDDPDKPAMVGLAFSHPSEQWSRRTGMSIARTRLQSSPLRLHFEGVIRPLTEADVMTGLRTLVIDNLKGWEFVDENVLKTSRANERWGAALIGPEGSLLTAYVDIRAHPPKANLFTRLKQKNPGDVPDPPNHPWSRNNGHWAMRIPVFGKHLLEGGPW